MTHALTGSLLFFRNEARLIMFQLQTFDFLFQRSVPLMQIKVHTATRTRLKYRPLFNQHCPYNPWIPISDLVLEALHSKTEDKFNSFSNSKTFTGSSIPPTKSEILYLAWSPGKTAKRKISLRNDDPQRSLWRIFTFSSFCSKSVFACVKRATSPRLRCVFCQEESDCHRRGCIVEGMVYARKMQDVRRPEGTKEMCHDECSYV